MYGILLVYIPSSCKVLNTYKANTSKTTIYMTIHLLQLHCSSSTHPSLHLTIGASMPVDQSSSTQMEAKLFLFFCGPKALKVWETHLVKVNQNTGFELIMVCSLGSFYFITALIDYVYMRLPFEMYQVLEN